MQPTISVVIPVHQASALLDECLDALETGDALPLECIVVDDGSTDDPATVAHRHGASLVTSRTRHGPAHARNLGAQVAQGDVLLFLDADVRPATDTVRRVREAFAHDDGLDALLGSYDDDPADPGFVSQYKNLMHCFVHRTANRKASTFWSGCGAIRRELFLEAGGFDPGYDRPSIEDIELGYRLVAAGRRIELDPHLTVKHAKRWTLRELVLSDVRDRAIPWTELIWRDRLMPNDLNLRRSQRLSVALTGLLLVASVIAAALILRSGAGPTRDALGLAIAGLWCVGAASIVGLNHRLFGFFVRRRGLAFAVAAIPLHLAYFSYGGAAFLAGTLRYAAGRVHDRPSLPPLRPAHPVAIARSA